MKWKVHFFDKHGTETRNIIVNGKDINTEEKAESEAAKEADKRGWDKRFKVADAEQL
jgi:hypothetical protein